jgi:hypothetical protein
VKAQGRRGPRHCSASVGMHTIGMLLGSCVTVSRGPGRGRPSRVGRGPGPKALESAAESGYPGHPKPEQDLA